MNNKIILIGLLAATITHASAATVEYTQDRRNVTSRFSSYISGTLTEDLTPSPLFSDWSIATSPFSYATQNSKLNASGFTATGTADFINAAVIAVSTSVFDISFRVSEGTALNLSGWFANNVGYKDTSLKLVQGDDINSTAIYYVDDYVPTSFNFSTMLNPGEYRLRLKASPGSAGPYLYTKYFLDASLTPVPIPAALLLFGSGLLGLIGFAPKKEQQSL